MKLTLATSLFAIILHSVAFCQIKTAGIDSSLAKKITISGFCLCQTTLSDLQKLDANLSEVEVEEMDLCNDGGFIQDSRFITRKGYHSSKVKGMIFQKDPNSEYISKIRLTKDFDGNLPDGTHINLSNLLTKDVFKIYPKLADTWNSRGCSDYWNLTNDTLSFFLKIDKNKKPQYPVDEAYYAEKPIEAVDLLISCYSIFNKSSISIFEEDEPVIYLDSIRVNKGVLKSYNPNEIALVSVYKDEDAIKLMGKKGKNGVIYIITKYYARENYWDYFKSKSSEYAKVIASSKVSSKEVIYILNGNVLEEKEADASLFEINDSNFIELKVLDKVALKKEYHISDKKWGISIKTKNIKK